LRREMSDAEKRLWSRLRGRQIGDDKFRRQAPLGAYVVDFCCLQRKLIVEVDGGEHVEVTPYEEARIAWLKAQGFHVLRFGNSDVIGNIDGVVETIMRALGLLRPER
jgi:very-short-patch-repair endonuclease